ncbi:uncharacterized protein PG986_014438 [Apiospora aurea]|uniref:Uncharacterized protein n=1 Tax=Apiospora aurea TaxID=335848 RepID=A0ABR1PTI6_9PEZI
MSLLYDLRFVPSGLSVLATLLRAFGVLSTQRRATQPLKACQLLRVKFRLELLLLSVGQIVLSLTVVLLFATLTVAVDTTIWTVYLLGSIVAVSMTSQCLWMSSVWPSSCGPFYLLRLAVGLPMTLGSFMGGVIIAGPHPRRGSTIFLQKHGAKGFVLVELFAVSLMAAAGALGMTYATSWRLVPVRRLYMLLVTSVGYAVEDLLAAIWAIWYPNDSDE